MHTDKQMHIRGHAHQYTVPVNAPWLGLFIFWSIFRVQRHRLLLYQTLIPSAHIMEKCPWLPGAQGPRAPRRSQKAEPTLSFETAKLIWLPWRERKAFFPFPLSKSRGPIHHLTRYTSCSQGSGGGGGSRRGGGGGKGGPRETNTWLGMLGKRWRALFVTASFHLKSWLDWQKARGEGGREGEGRGEDKRRQTRLPRQATWKDYRTKTLQTNTDKWRGRPSTNAVL